MIRLALLAVALVLLAPKAEAQTTGHTTGCLVAATPVSFGTFSGARIDTTATITLLCQGNGNNNPYSVALSQGISNSFVDRFMIHGLADELQYNLYVDATRTTIWGNGQGETRLQAGQLDFPGGINSTAAARLTVYARLPAQRMQTPGTYADQIIVTVTF